VAVSNGGVIGHLQLTRTDDPRQTEIKNMEVRETRQGQGVGRLLVQAAVELAPAEAVTTVVVATAAADRQPALLPAAGLPEAPIERDAFTAATGYPPGLCIDGIELRDRVWLDGAVLASVHVVLVVPE
jgi:GNAT superfamily N-acetyltransferase